MERCLTAYYVKHIYLKLQHRVYASSIVKLFFCRKTLVAVGLPSLNWDKFPRYKSTANVVMMVKSLPFGFLLRTKIYTTFMVFSIQCCKSTQLYCCLIWNNKFALSDIIFHFHVSIFRKLWSYFILCLNYFKNRWIRILPNASRIVLASSICCWTQVDMLAVTEHRYSRMNFVDSVFPAPDSPEITRLWSFISYWSDL